MRTCQSGCCGGLPRPRRLDSSARALWPRKFHVLPFLLLLTVGGCTEGAPADSEAADGPRESADLADVGDSVDDCDGERVSGICLAALTRTPASECPGALYDPDGICLPERPRMLDWPCPPSWLTLPAVSGGAAERYAARGVAPFAICEPPPPLSGCPAGTWAPLGATECLPLGSSCPDGDAPWLAEIDLVAFADAEVSRILYVAAGAAETDAVGSRAQPFGSISAAVEAARPGDLVALGRGEHAGGVSLTVPVTLVGACVRETLLRGGAADGGPVLALPSGARVANLTVAGGSVGIQVASPGADVVLGPLLVAEAATLGVHVEGGRTSVVLDEVVVDGRDGPGAGVRVERGAVVNARHVVIQRVAGYGLSVLGGEVTLEDSWLADIRNDGSDFGEVGGLLAQLGAVVRLERVALWRAPVVGLGAADPGTVVTVTDALVAEAQPLQEGGEGFGFGVWAGAGAHLTLERVGVRDCADIGLLTELGATLAGTDLRVAHTVPISSDNRFGYGLAIFGEDVRAELSRVILEGNHGVGLVIFGGRATLTDILSVDTRPEPGTGHLGFGMSFAFGAVVAGQRLAVLEASDVGVLISRSAHAQLEDLYVADTRPRPIDDLFGRGVEINRRSQVDLRRAALLGNRGAALWIGIDSQLTLWDGVLAETRPHLGDGTVGRGLNAADSNVVLERVVVRDNADLGVGVFGGELVAIDLLLRDTTALPTGGGTGVALVGAVGRFERFRIESNAFVGLQLIEDVVVNALDGLIRSNLIGLNVQVDGLDLASSFERVVSVDNVEEVSYATLPVPSSLNFK
jgi:hypothetical protein